MFQSQSSNHKVPNYKVPNHKFPTVTKFLNPSGKGNDAKASMVFEYFGIGKVGPIRWKGIM
jgi:hypothetical protein